MFTVEMTRQAETQMAALPEDAQAKARKFLDRHLPGVKLTDSRVTKMGKAPFGDCADLFKFRAGRVRILAAIDHDTATVLGFGLREAK